MRTFPSLLNRVDRGRESRKESFVLVFLENIYRMQVLIFEIKLASPTGFESRL